MKIGALEFNPENIPWRVVVGGIAGALLIGLLSMAWFGADSQDLINVLNQKLKYTGNSNEAALWETQMGPRVHGAVVSLCARFPWLSPLFGYRDGHTAQMLSYIYRAYKPDKTQLLHAAWLYETDVVVKADGVADTKYEQVLYNVITVNKIPLVDTYKPKPTTAWDVVSNYVMPIGAFLIMVLMIIPK